MDLERYTEGGETARTGSVLFVRLSGLSFLGFTLTHPMSAGMAARSVIAPYRFPAREICLLPGRFAPPTTSIL